MTTIRALLFLPASFILAIPVYAQDSGWIGISIGDQNDRGALIRSVEPNSPAEKAGLRANDIVVQFNKQEVVGALQLTRLVSETPAGRSVDVTVRRDNREQTFNVTTEKAPFSFGGIRIQQPEVSVLKDRLNRSLSDMVWVSSSTAQAGIRVDSLTPQLREFFGVKGSAGVLVASVEQDSNAAKSGLKAGDVIMAVDGTTVSTPTEFTRALRRPATPFALQVVRDKLERDIRVQ